MAMEFEDVPCYEITLKITVTGHNAQQAHDFLNNFFKSSKSVDECDIWDWDFIDWEEV